MLLATIGMKAQYQRGDLFVYPRIGFSLANVTQNELMVGTSVESLKSKKKAGLTAGVEAELFVSNVLSLSAGAFYANQGYRYADWGEQDVKARTFSNLEDIHTTMHFINIPVMLNGYLADGLALKAGLQAGYLIKAQSYMKEKSGIIDEANIYTVTESNTTDETTTDIFNRFDLSIPIGISYEYKRVVLDLRYNIGLSKVFKNLPSNSGHHQVLMFTMGYQIEL